jgi:putative iron-dependent peroxidase
MPIPQTGIFSLGDAAHVYMEFTRLPGTDAKTFVEAIVNIHEPHQTVGGSNVVIGFRPDVWRELLPDGLPPDLTAFTEPLPGSDGYSMPATQSDAWLWIAGASYDTVFDLGREAIAAIAGVATLDRHVNGWSYKHSRDLTGFEDGTKNPSLLVAPALATIPDGAPGAGGSVLLFQVWQHQAKEWESLPVSTQERVIGRTKPDSVELAEDIMPEDSHVSRTTVDIDGDEKKIFRRNTSYGDVTEFGTIFVGFSADQLRLDRMLRRMSGAEDGMRDALTRYSVPLTGSYYFVPSLADLQRFAAPEDPD